MSSLDVWEQIIGYLAVAFSLALIVRLIVSQLVERYPFFSGFIAVSCLQTFVSLQVPRDTTLYGSLYFFSEPLIWLFFFLVVIELYRQILKDYPSISAIGRRIVQGSFLTALVISFLTVIPGGRDAGHYPVLEAYLLADRTAVLFVLFFMLLLLGFLFRYPISVRRNTTFCFVGYFVLFLAKMIDLIAATQFERDTVQPMAVTSQVIACACLLFWTIALSRKGEEWEAAVTPPWRGEERERLLDQLRSLNETLTELNHKKILR